MACADCTDVFHVSCAYKQGYTFGMEINLVRLALSKNDTLVRLTFRAAITSGQVVSQGYQRRQVPRGARHVSLLLAFPFPLQKTSILTTSVVPLPQHERQNHLQEARH